MQLNLSEEKEYKQRGSVPDSGLLWKSKCGQTGNGLRCVRYQGSLGWSLSERGLSGTTVSTLFECLIFLVEEIFQ